MQYRSHIFNADSVA